MTVQDPLLNKTASVDTSWSKTTGSSKSPCLMYEPNTSSKYGTLNGACPNIPCSIQEDYSSYDETTPSPKTSRWRCEEDDTTGTMLIVMGSQVFSHLTTQDIEAETQFAILGKAIVFERDELKTGSFPLSTPTLIKGFLDYTSSACQSALGKATVFERDKLKNWSTALRSLRPVSTKGFTTERWKRSPDCRTQFVCLSFKRQPRRFS